MFATVVGLPNFVSMVELPVHMHTGNLAPSTLLRCISAAESDSTQQSLSLLQIPRH